MFRATLGASGWMNIPEWDMTIYGQLLFGLLTSWIWISQVGNNSSRC